MDLEKGLSLLVESNLLPSSPARKVDLEQSFERSLAICMECLVAAKRQFAEKLYEFRNYEKSFFAQKAAALQLQFEAMPEYKVIMLYGDEQQRSWAETLRLSIANVPPSRLAGEVVLALPTIKVWRARLRACFELAAS